MLPVFALSMLGGVAYIRVVVTSIVRIDVTRARVSTLHVE